jgi:hypothetical protein
VGISRPSALRATNEAHGVVAATRRRAGPLGLTSVADYALKLEITGGITRTGTTAADSLLGGSMDDSLDGGAGNDTLDGSDGNDTLNGQAGDDLLTGGQGNDRLDGGDGIDTASYLGATGGVNVNLATGTATGAASNDTLIAIEHLWGSAYADTLVGSAGANYIAAGQGADSVDAGAGDDLIRGGTGNDTLDGGVGKDTIYYDTARSSATVVHNSASGQFTVSTATEGVDVVRGVETFVFAGVTYTAASLIDTTPPSAVTFSPMAAAVAVGVTKPRTRGVDQQSHQLILVDRSMNLCSGLLYQQLQMAIQTCDFEGNAAIGLGSPPVTQWTQLQADVEVKLTMNEDGRRQ